MERELLFEGKENVSSINIKEFSAEGAKVDITLAGKISGKVRAYHDYPQCPHETRRLRGRRSQVNHFTNGEPVFVFGKATSKFVDPTPIRRVEENLMFQTPSQRLAYFNSTKGWSEGLYNLATGEYSFKVYAVK